MVQKLCTQFTRPITTLDSPTGDELPTAHHPFPPPSALAEKGTSTKLRTMGFGYRAEFIEKTASMLLEEHGSDEKIYEWLQSLRSVETAAARCELLKLMGVGRKVADCVLLMSLDKVRSCLR